MPQEEKFPTLKIFKCGKCGSVFLDNFAGSKECPDCETISKTPFSPGEHPTEPAQDVAPE